MRVESTQFPLLGAMYAYSGRMRSIDHCSLIRSTQVLAEVFMGTSVYHIPCIKGGFTPLECMMHDVLESTK